MLFDLIILFLVFNNDGFLDIVRLLLFRFLIVIFSLLMTLTFPFFQLSDLPNEQTPAKE